ncbi:anthranilate synthase component I [Litorimonas cladophorae]|uniref:Anthranilate synthase component 1 n=1 Tax=Litorimonas cladophorae TaxID=1220491 RepID=A0A918NB92_9PROT|nr:anthranilate synthase component I [Litorimonas cladophorae]GGX57790.1 anthranilate synthase component I [Litorimonas cladophorae]
MTLTFFPSRDTVDTQKAQLVHARVINDIDTPVSAFLKAGLGKPYAFLFESVTGGEQRGRYSFFGFDPDIVWRSHGDQSEISRDGGSTYSPYEGKPLDALRALQDEVSFDLPEDIPPMASGLFGYLGYDMVRQVESLPGAKHDPIGTPDAIKVRPRIVCIFDQVAQEIIIASPLPANGNYDEACARIERVAADLALPVSANFSRDVAIPTLTPTMGTDASTFGARVAKAKDYILAGDVFQVVIGQRLSAPLPASPFALYRSLRRMNPSPFLYFLDFDDHQVIGSSPEILVRLRDNTVTVRPIAGTRPRGKTTVEDNQFEADLLADPKECAEHLMLLDLGRNDVGRVAKPGTVKVTERFTIERYSHVMHIVSNVIGEIRDGLDTLDALFAGFPAGTVSGAPKVRAMEIIDELEDEKRGIYAGAIGYLSVTGDMDTAIALRTAIVKDGTLHVRAGAGIVMDSVAQMEFEETIHKSNALFRAAEQSVRFGGNR